MKPTDLKERTMIFTVKVMDFIESIPTNRFTRIIASQIVRSASSVGANYRAARRSKSGRDFINKLKIVEEEADETLYWLEILERRRIGSPELVDSLIKEATELLAIIVTSINTAKSNLELQNHKK